MQQPKKQFMKSDESAFSIVPSRLSSRLSISTGQTSRPNSASSHVNMTYHRLSFEDDLFTARAYKRNYRNARLQRYRRREFDLDHKATFTVADSDNDTTNLSAKTAKRIAEEDVGQQEAHGIMVTTEFGVDPSTIEKDGLHDRPVFKSRDDLYAEYVEACGRLRLAVEAIMIWQLSPPRKLHKQFVAFLPSLCHCIQRARWGHADVTASSRIRTFSRPGN